MREASLTLMEYGKRILRTSRVEDWGVHILLYVLCGMLYQFTWTGEAAEFWFHFLTVLAVQVPSYLGTYMLNDATDHHTDLLRASPQVRSPEPPGMQYAVLAFAVYGIAAVAVLDLVPLSLALLTGIVAIIYSLPPIRLKTRGMLGVLAAALFQRLPYFLMLVFALGRPNTTALLIAAYLLGTGLLFIIYHQCEDAEDDRRSGTITWIIRRGVVSGCRFCRICSAALALLPVFAWAGFVSGMPEASTDLFFLTGFTALTILTLMLFALRYGALCINSTHLDGTSVLLIGATGGIGSELVPLLAERGCRIILVGRDETKLRELADIYGTSVTAVHSCDFESPASIDASHTTITKTAGIPDIVIFASGIGIPMDAGTMTPDVWIRSVQINLTAVGHWIALLIPGMLARGSGMIVGISSLAAGRGIPMGVAYAPSKAGLSVLFEGLRTDLRHSGIDVILVEPGFVRTGMTRRLPYAPFMIGAAAAARRIMKGMQRREPLVRFPFPMRVYAVVVRLLPVWMFDRIMGSSHPARQPLKSDEAVDAS